MKRRRAKLAAPLVLTFAVLPACASAPLDDGGCHPPDCHMNPPPLPLPPATAAASASEVPSATPTPTATATPPTTKVAADPLPPATTGNVMHRPDGTCWEFTQVHCPQGVHCNPPPPHQVACPAKP
ncbi:MAG TPA: hypothetical protein VGM56_04525 [Byssovorax sp.]|jgi:hypothetical protein